MTSIVLGGAGNLGRSLVRALKYSGIKPINLDFKTNSDAYHNIIVNEKLKLSEQSHIIIENLASSLKGEGVDGVGSVFCSAGGYVDGSISDSDILAKINRMYTLNIDTAAFSAHLGAQFLLSNGLLMLTGASVALQPTPISLAYGLSKSATHFIASSVAKDKIFLQRKISVIGILPQVIDTTENRYAQPGADYSDWSKPDDIARVCVEWVTDPSTRPKTGSLLNVRSSREESVWA